MTNCKIFPHCPPHCGCAPGADPGDVITLIDEGAALLAAHPRADLDIDTRLMLARISIDVTTEHLTQEATEAASDAIAEAEALSVPDTHIAAVSAALGNTVLALAGDVIRERGWAQGEIMDDRGAVCAIGAIRVAANRLGADSADACEVLAQRIGRSIPKWNDASGRTVADVLAVLH